MRWWASLPLTSTVEPIGNQGVILPVYIYCLLIHKAIEVEMYEIKNIGRDYNTCALPYFRGLYLLYFALLCCDKTLGYYKDKNLKTMEPVQSQALGTTSTSTNNGNNRAAGNKQPGTTPGSVNTTTQDPSGSPATPATPTAPPPTAK